MPRIGVGQRVGRGSKPLPFDDDAAAIIAATEAADGQALEFKVKRAINSFVIGAKAASVVEIWSYLSAGAFRFLAGPRTLSGVVAAGAGVSPTNVGLDASDFDRFRGIKGGVISKYLNTNFPSNTFALNNQSFGVYITEAQTIATGVHMAAFVSTAPYRASQISDISNTAAIYVNRNSSTSDVFAVRCNRLTGITSTSATTYSARISGGNYTGIIGPSAIPESKYVLARRFNTGVDAPCNARIAFYWDGPALPVAGLARLEALVEQYLFDISLPEISIGPTFLFLGESNSGGYALNSELVASEIDANPDLRILNNSTLLLEPLDIGSNNMLGHTGLESFVSTVHGWEAGIQQHLLTETGLSKCYLLKCGQGGSTINQWDQDTDAYWLTLAQRVDRFKALVSNPDFRVWFTFGINDAIAGTDPATWRTATEAWIARVRTLVGVPGLTFYATKLMANSTAKSAINLQLDTIAATDPNFILLDTTNTTTYPLRDTNHWNAAALKLMAQQFLRLE